MSIHKNRRKVEACHNCHNMLKLSEDNFCANCVIRNHDLEVGGQLLYDVLKDFTNFDTKFYDTAKLNFFRNQCAKITFKDFLKEEGHACTSIRL